MLYIVEELLAYMWACDYEILIANNAFWPWMILRQFAITLP